MPPQSTTPSRAPQAFIYVMSRTEARQWYTSTDSHDATRRAARLRAQDSRLAEIVIRDPQGNACARIPTTPAA